VFTARYALSPYVKQIRFVFKGLIYIFLPTRTLRIYIYIIYKESFDRSQHFLIWLPWGWCDIHRNTSGCLIWLFIYKIHNFLVYELVEQYVLDSYVHGMESCKFLIICFDLYAYQLLRFSRINGDEFLLQGPSSVSVLEGRTPHLRVRVYQGLIYSLPM
jgi:hypothetical protein